MDPLLLAGLLAALVVVPLALIGFFALIGKAVSAPKRFGTVLFLVLFAAALGGVAWIYLRAGTVSQGTVTTTSERVVADDALRTRHEFELTVEIPGQGTKQVAVPARIYDATDAGDTLVVRSGSVLGLKVARAEGERVTDLMPIGSIACGVLVVLLAAVAASSRKARAPAAVLMFAAVAGIGVQPAIAALPQGGVTVQTSATVKGSTLVGSSSAPSTKALAYLRGPFSIDHRWMWANGDSLSVVAVTFVPDGSDRPVTAADVVTAGSVPSIGDQVQVRYLASDPRNVTLPGSQAAECAWILLALLTGIEVALLFVGLLIWRLQVRMRRRRAQKQIELDRDISRDIELSTRRDGGPGGPGDPEALQPVPSGHANESLAEETRPLPAVRPGAEPPPSYPAEPPPAYPAYPARSYPDQPVPDYDPPPPVTAPPPTRRSSPPGF